MTDYELFGEVFPADEEFYKNRVMRSVDRFLADIGIYTKEKVCLVKKWKWPTVSPAERA
jgi:hypothetical protein